MIKLTSKLSALVFGLAFSLSSTFSPAAFAADVGPGTVVAVTGTTTAVDPTLAGLILYDEVLPFSITLVTGGTITGTFQDRVVRNTLGTLDFYARITNGDNSAGDVTGFLRAYLNNYPGTGSNAYMDYRTDGLGSVAPLWATRSPDSSGAGFYFDSTNGLAAGQESYFMFYRTTATEFDLKGVGYVAHYNNNGSNDPYDYSYLTLAQPVPEPETYALFMVGLGLLGAVARRRKNS